ncbi:hypothetical protein BJ875DRAFT_164279 [Amylocarpus encephaloides]|uniref:Uncharacterized protein n=1 Tax=Amylocarpus encephaloides TaxID=45428 RepID=A0A9P7YNW2_9HELO|nr:hypothetical protein BJ875DRAFT_164279 [Amylocarpus encephaloides]
MAGYNSNGPCASLVSPDGPATIAGYGCTPGAYGFVPNVATCTNASELTIGQPSFLNGTPGRACAVSTNFTKTSTGTDVLANTTTTASIFQQCCGTGNPTEDFVKSGYGVTGGPCGYTFCNITDGASADAFMSCIGKNAPGVTGQCFVNYVGGAGAAAVDEPAQPASASSTATQTSTGTRNSVGLGIMLGVMIGIARLSGI